ncbi:glycosyl hydrolase family 61-domain-containing protein [Xylariales sp. AK1849]|nr:glycosyl hydrolase family 61-domain-containing protein [Xylariales sp. AK1849]
MRSLTLLCLLSGVSAHTIFTALFINDIPQGDGTCVRETSNLAANVDPVRDFLSDDITCGFGGNTPVAYTCPAPAGAKLTFEYRETANTAGSGFIDPSHKGPCAVYAKKLSALDDEASGSGWFKIWDEGYDEAADLWCTEKLINDDGYFSIDIPAALPSGNYLFRPEVVAMHNTTPAVEPQFYVGCAQVFIESDITGALDIPEEYAVSIPGYIQAGDAGVTYNIYVDEEYADLKIPYPGLGPGAWAPSATTGSGDVTTQTEGAVPEDCLLKNANWCGVEVASYSDLTGCWAAVTDCWAQNDACWDAAPPSGGRNCGVWETKCQDMDDQCTAKNFAGPPTFELVSADWPAPDVVPAAMNAGEASATATSETSLTSSTAAAASSIAAQGSQPTGTAASTTTDVSAFSTEATPSSATLMTIAMSDATTISATSSSVIVTLQTLPVETAILATASAQPSHAIGCGRTHNKQGHKRRALGK